MKIFITFSIIIILSVLASSCNLKNDNTNISIPTIEPFHSELSKADSIILISHDDAYSIKSEGISAPNDSLLLIVDDKINKKIIHEYIKVSLDDNLLELLSEQRKDSVIQNNQCFLPHHAILFYFGKKISYVDLCFQCKQWQSSDDSSFSKIYISSDSFIKWENYFYKKGIRYFPKFSE